MSIINKNLSELSITFLAGILGSGGAERQLFYILRTLKNLDCRVNLIVLNKGQFWEKPIIDLGIKIYYAGENENRIIRLIKIISILKKIQPNLIQSQHFYTNIYAAIGGRILGIKNIGAIRSNGSYEVEVMGKIFGKLCIYLPNFIAANSYSGLDYVKKIGVNPNRLRYLPNAVDTNKFYPIKEITNTGEVKILLISNLWFPEKRVDTFISALSNLRFTTNVLFKALIIGDGPLKEKMIKLSIERGIYPKYIEIIEACKNIEEKYREFDILVLTSEREGTPNVILEAMSSGLPVIATNVGGISDLIQNGINGFLINPGDVDLLEKKLKTLLEDPELRMRMGKISRNFIEERYSLQKFDDVIRNFYLSFS